MMSAKDKTLVFGEGLVSWELDGFGEAVAVVLCYEARQKGLGVLWLVGFVYVCIHTLLFTISQGLLFNSTIFICKGHCYYPNQCLLPLSYRFLYVEHE